jgi:hypothetical protein
VDSDAHLTPATAHAQTLGASCSGQMDKQEEIKDKESFDRDFCEHLEYHLGRTFTNSDDKEIHELWCDGILDPFIESQLTKKNVNDTRTIVTTAFIGHDGQGKYEMTIRLGQQSLRQYAKGSSMIDCLPSEESMDWITLDLDNQKIEVRLK